MVRDACKRQTTAFDRKVISTYFQTQRRLRYACKRQTTAYACKRQTTAFDQKVISTYFQTQRRLRYVSSINVIASITFTLCWGKQ